MSEMLDAARRYVFECGMSVIPLRHWSKHPDGRLLSITTGQPDHYGPSDSRAAWRVFTERMPTDADLRYWFQEGTDCGIGIVGGAVSGGLVRIDFEHRACLPTWYQSLFDDSVLFEAARSLPVVQTPKGHHIYLRMAGPPGHEILCQGMRGSDAIVFAETQGAGCYCVAPPTALGDDRYLWCSLTGPEAIPLLDREIATKLLDAARFPGFWSPAFQGSWDSRHGALTRAGLHLGLGPNDLALYFDWQHLSSLSNWMARYGPLLKIVEEAPPPPPSYNELDDDGVF